MQAALGDELVHAPTGDTNRLGLPSPGCPHPVGDFWLELRSRTFAEFLIDCEESPHTRGVVMGMLREKQLWQKPYLDRQWFSPS